MGLPRLVLRFPIEHGETIKVVTFRTMRDEEWEDENRVLSMWKDDMSMHSSTNRAGAATILRTLWRGPMGGHYPITPYRNISEGKSKCVRGPGAYKHTIQGAGRDCLGRCPSHAERGNGETGDWRAFGVFEEVRRPRRRTS